MSMVTQCPSCATTFRVTPQHLQAHHGMVRCGRCATVFDGFKSLATLPDETRDTETVIEEPEEISGAPGLGVSASASIAPDVTPDLASSYPAVSAPRSERPEQEAAPSALAGHEAMASALPDEATEVVTRPAGQMPQAEMSLPPEVATPSMAAEAPPAVEQASIPPVSRSKAVRQETVQSAVDGKLPRRSSGWWIGVTALLIVLAGQAVYLFRTDIAATVPELRPALTKVCEFLRCSVPLPQRPRQITIEASDMQAADPANPGRITLTATLRNHATTEIGYPALDVVLTNAKEHTVARRIFAPEEYLGARRNPLAGIAPNAEVTIRLDLDTGDLGAVGFRLDLLAAS